MFLDGQDGERDHRTQQSQDQGQQTSPGAANPNPTQLMDHDKPDDSTEQGQDGFRKVALGRVDRGVQIQPEEFPIISGQNSFTALFLFIQTCDFHGVGRIPEEFTQVIHVALGDAGSQRLLPG